jgi:hypothetical protein
MESLAIEHGEHGDWLGAVELLRRRAASDPHNARVVLHLMEALDASGDRASALRHATVHAALLKSELGAAPDPTVAAFADKLRRDPSLRPVSVDRDEAPPPDREAVRESQDGDDHIGATSVSRRPVALRAVAAMAVVALLTMGLFRGRLVHAGDDPTLNRIAILPFRTSGPDPDMAALREGLVELLSLESPATSDPWRWTQARR